MTRAVVAASENARYFEWPITGWKEDERQQQIGCMGSTLRCKFTLRVAAPNPDASAEMAAINVAEPELLCYDFAFAVCRSRVFTGVVF